MCMIEYIDWIGLQNNDPYPNIAFLPTIVGVTIGLGLISLLMDLMFACFDWLPDPVIHTGWKHFKDITGKSARKNFRKSFSKKNNRKLFYARKGSSEFVEVKDEQ